jgi:hypothetical protein
MTSNKTDDKLLEIGRKIQRSMQKIVDRDSSGMSSISISVGDNPPVVIASRKPAPPAQTGKEAPDAE